MSIVNNIEFDLLFNANKTNDLVIINSMLKEIIFQYKNNIEYIKNIFPYLNNSNNKEILKENIKNIIKENLKEFVKKNNKLKLECQNIESIYNKKIEEKNVELFPLIHILNKLKDENFILSNSIMMKDSFLRIYRNNIKKLRELYYYGHEEENKERYLLYNNKLYYEHIKELEKFQESLNKYSKNLNKESISNRNLENEAKKLKRMLNQNPNSRILNTETFYFNNILYQDEEIENSLIFNDLEKEIEISNSSSFSDDESYINYDLELNLNLNLKDINNSINSNFFQDLNKTKIPLKNKIYTSDYKEQKIPQLNLKQIKSNKIRVNTENNYNYFKNDNNSVQYKIIKMKKKIQRQKLKIKKYTDIISNFKSHYIKMKIYIKRLTLSLNNENINVPKLII